MNENLCRCGHDQTLHDFPDHKGADCSEGECPCRHFAPAAPEAEPEWTDTPDKYTAEIQAAFPTRSGSHQEYARAMEMVRTRQSKGALVALVNWLLLKSRAPEAEPEPDPRVPGTWVQTAARPEGQSE